MQSLFLVILLLTTSADATSHSKSTRKDLPKMKTESIVLAGGCFWGVQDIIRKVAGVISTEVGYSGGFLDNPTYKDITKGTTGHAEAVRVTFDPTKVSLETVLDYFFRLHDPTTLNRQGNDIGTQYRSLILYADAEQRRIAEKKKQDVDKSGKWKKPLTTEIAELKKFYRAESEHQDYLIKNPDGYTCHYLRN